MEQFTTLECISNPVGGDLISNALWKGVSLRDLRDRAGLKPGVVDLAFRCWDDYTDSIPLEKALHPDTVLAYEMNGETLPMNHGFPVRLIVPGSYGMKNVNWITRIEAVDHDFEGLWEQQGWSDVAVIETISRFDVPGLELTLPAGDVDVGGVAFAGNRGAKVEISTDEGATWQQAHFEPAFGPYTWVLWPGSRQSQACQPRPFVVS